MLDIAPSEFMLVAFVALVVIGPKDLPKALRVAGYWVGKARGVARQFRQGFDNMVREAELEEMEKRWRAENERIMREHPVEALPAPTDPDAADAQQPPVTVEQPDIAPAPGHETADHDRPVMTALPATSSPDPEPRHADGTAS